MAETGSFAIVLPLLQVSLAGEYGGPFPSDTSNALDGLDMTCVADVFVGGPAASVPAQGVRYDKALPYPQPTMVNGRPT